MMLADLEVYPNKVNWVYLVKGLLSRLGFYHVWLNQDVGNANAFLIQFKQRLNDNFTQNCHERESNSSRAFFHINIADCKPESYLTPIKVLKFRNSVARLRVSSHRLEIEAGRWTRPRTPVNERLCNTCNCLEDEFGHCVIFCLCYILSVSAF